MTSHAPTPASARSDAPASGPRLHASGRVDRLTFGLGVANLVAQIGIILTGGAVRLTGSGLGCSTWPMCEPGQFAPVFHEEMGIHPIIEFGNRTLTGVLTVIAVALLLALYLRRPVRERRGLKPLAWWVLIGIAAQAVIGGISVLVSLHPLLVGVHMFVSLVLVAISTHLVLRMTSPDGPARPILPARLTWVPWALLGLAVVLGYIGTLVTGTGPLSGDASEIVRLGFDHASITRVHALSAWALTGITVIALVGVSRAPRTPELAQARRALVGLLAACLLTGVIGYTQYIAGLPALMVGMHMVGSALVVAAVTWVATRSFARAEAPAVTCAQALAHSTPVDSGALR